MHSRIGAAAVAVTVIIVTGCSGTPQSNLTQDNGSLASLVRSQSAFGRSASMMRKAAVTETVLHSFAGSPNDGGDPNGLTNMNGTLYGTTVFGGTHGNVGAGTVFSITTSGVETILYNFVPGKHGYQPQGGLTVVGGALYGTTYEGGLYGDGTVFRIATSGKERPLHSFAGSPNDGSKPRDLIDVNGTLYGTTNEGGSSGFGTVYKITQKGEETVLYSFKGGTDGADPGGLFYLKGTIYGTTGQGGGSGCVQGEGCGTAFKITPAGAYSQLHRFGNENDGQLPGGLVNVGSKLYGTTAYGGAYGEGTVFRITTAGAERVLYGFTGVSDGANPEAGLLNVNGMLYGTTAGGGGSSGDGTIYKITTDGAYTHLYNFGESPDDGRLPFWGLIDVNGTLYGTTAAGGTYQDGTVFSLSGF